MAFIDETAALALSGTVAPDPELATLVARLDVVQGGGEEAPPVPPEGAPIDPALVTRSAAAIDSLYEARGLYLSQVEVDSVPVNFLDPRPGTPRWWRARRARSSRGRCRAGSCPGRGSRSGTPSPRPRRCRRRCSRGPGCRSAAPRVLRTLS